ncbi:MAG: hypothetical protein ACYCTL_11965 [Acidimicrobiales bacterium]
MAFGGLFTVLVEPGHVASGERGVVCEPAFELRDPGGPAAEGVGDPLEADASVQMCRTEAAAGWDGFGTDEVAVNPPVPRGASGSARSHGAA